MTHIIAILYQTRQLITISPCNVFKLLETMFFFASSIYNKQYLLPSKTMSLHSLGQDEK